ncbi:hypothetical protein OAF54_02990 [bacterium]|nr:hypothetical protein [bacterium]
MMGILSMGAKEERDEYKAQLERLKSAAEELRRVWQDEDEFGNPLWCTGDQYDWAITDEFSEALGNLVTVLEEMK